MTKNYSLSLPAAILVNINIMIGAGIFVNTVVLAQSAGAFGALAYLVVACMLLPLIITFARLMKHHKGGSFYDYGATLHPFIGFVSGWSYFTAKLASASLGIHVFSKLLQQLVPALSIFPLVLCDIAIVILFTILNTLNLRIGRSIQYGFLSVKLVPILFAVGVGLYFFSGSAFNNQHFIFSQIATSLPFVLYAFTGFEACCSLSGTIENPERNGPRALLISYILGVCIAVIYQLMFFGALTGQLAALSDYSQAFPALLSKVFSPASGAYQIVFFMLNMGIATSSLGAAYGIMYSNAWNLFALGQAGYTFMAKSITSLNRYKVPFVCILVEGLIIISYVSAFHGNLVPLQQICSLGMIITYTISAGAFVVLMWKLRSRIEILPLCALLSCLLLAIGYKDNIMAYGVGPTIYFLTIVLLGILMFALCASKKQRMLL